MYIHIGADVSLPAEWIIGIFDLDTVTSSAPDTVKFLSTAETESRVDILTEDIPRTVVLTINRVIFSPVSTATLSSRWQKGMKRSSANRLIKDDLND